MRTDKIDLYKSFHVKREGAKAGLLTVYRHDESAEKLLRPAMLVIPGGAYAMVSPNEGEPVALEYFRVGTEAFVLDYDVAPVPYPAQIRQAAMAMMYIRKNAQAFGILPDKIAAVGFSAGGHLLGCISTLWDDPAVKELFGEHAYKLNISSTKSMTGHLLGAAGAVEALISLKAVQEDIVPPTINHADGDNDEEIDYNLNFTFNKAQKREIRAALSNTFGFGGHNACVIIKKFAK